MTEQLMNATVENTVETTETTPGVAPQPEKTFTQAELNAIASREKKEAVEKLLKEAGFEDFENYKQGMEQFKQWKEQQLTESERKELALKETQEKYEQLAREKEELEIKLIATSLKVKPDSLDDVKVLATTLLKKDESLSMQSAMQAVLEKYPLFAEQPHTETPIVEDASKPTYLTQQKKTESAMEDAFAKKLAAIRGKK